MPWLMLAGKTTIDYHFIPVISAGRIRQGQYRSFSLSSWPCSLIWGKNDRTGTQWCSGWVRGWCYGGRWAMETLFPPWSKWLEGYFFDDVPILIGADVCYFPDAHEGVARVPFRFQYLLEQLPYQVAIFKIKLVIVTYFAFITWCSLSSEQCQILEPPEDGSTQLQWHYNYIYIMNVLILNITTSIHVTDWFASLLLIAEGMVNRPILLIFNIWMSKKTEKPAKSPEKKSPEKEKKAGFPLCINNKEARMVCLSEACD